jgi:hypothetical protein
MVSQAALDCLNGVNYDWVVNPEVIQKMKSSPQT